MSDNIIHLNENVLKSQLSELVRETVEPVRSVQTLAKTPELGTTKESS